MQKILEDLYLGNINPNEKLNPQDKNYRTTLQKSCDLEERLLKDLTKEQKTVFYNLTEARTSSNAAEVTQGFADGFKLGALIMLEVLWERIQNN